MPLSVDWASLQDFATLFQYLWYRDFPIDEISRGGKRSDWTIHVGIVVRNVADLMGLVTRFESGGRKDAVLRSTAGDEIDIEWEWEGVWGANEIKKLREHHVWSKESGDDKRPLRYAVLVTYTHPPNVKKVCDYVQSQWEDAKWPLLLILIDVEESTKYTSGKDFQYIQAYQFDEHGETELRRAPAFPWRVEGTRWYQTWQDQSPG
ncbi:MAG TPA: hypothetical protein VMW13_04950 [Dehalococcoidales bacterium]|nr:hypothetical protein [Dehalococcoidales bacterium]